MRMPFDAGVRVVSPYGNRIDPITGLPAWHGGLDLVGLDGDRYVLSVADGEVMQSRIVTDPNNRTSEWGNYVSVWGDDGRAVYYCHLEARAVEAGQRVKAGQLLGIEGTTGRSTGIHLHFEVRNEAGQQISAAQYLGIPNTVGFEYRPAPPVDPWIEQAHDWSRDAVDWAVRKGILKGKGGDNYALGDYVTREELCVMLYRAREVL